jgi:tetratricopeptide (TPR) repeat protein
MAAAQTGGFRAIGARLADLQAILARAPSPFLPREERPDAIYIRPTSTEACLIDLAAAAVGAKTSPRDKRIVCLLNPYPAAALMVGSYFDELRQPERALAVIDRGLTFAPDYPSLVIERGAALMQLRRFPEMLRNDKDGLEAASVFITAPEKGALLRGQGYALTELGRLDEAEAVYRQSLKIDPDHGHAEHELTYIAGLRRGQAATASQITSEINPTPH